MTVRQRRGLCRAGSICLPPLFPLGSPPTSKKATLGRNRLDRNTRPQRPAAVRRGRLNVASIISQARESALRLGVLFGGPRVRGVCERLDSP